jgi:hypothetical protein
MAMSGIGASTANYSALLPSPFSPTSADGEGTQVQPGSALSPDQIAQLRRKLQQEVDQAFKQGGSPDEIGKLLQKKVSDTLAKFGVSETDRNSVADQLSQIFSSEAPSDQLRTQAQQLLQSTVDNLQGGTGAAAVSASPGGAVGQNVDLLG